MKLFRRLVFVTLFALCLLPSAYAFEVPSAHAQTLGAAEGLQAVASQTKLSSADPRAIAARIINAALGLLAIIFVVIIIYAGFLYMTSGGDADKTTKAKAWIKNGIIGLIIILSSWAIVSFVISRLLQATGSGGVGGSGDGGGGGGGLGGGGSSSVFQLRAITPSGVLTIRNVEVRFLFTRDVSQTTAAAQIQVFRASDNQPVAGTVTVSGSLVTFVPQSACPAPNEARKCLEGDTEFIAKAGTGLRSAGGQALSCGGFSPSCEGRFKTGNLVDVSPPSAQILSPVEGQSVSADDIIRIQTRVTDDAGVSLVETSVDNKGVGQDSPFSTSTVLDFIADVPWPTAGVAVGSHTLQSVAHDVDSNSGTSASVSVMIRPAFCFNGKKDGDETGLDCGGSCGACSGGACKTNGDCSSGVCLNNVCVEQPIITGFSPADGRPGTFVTISGVNFGDKAGKVVFAGNKIAVAPQICAVSGIPVWTDSQVLVELPEGAQTGSIQLTNSGSNLLDATDDTRGPKLNGFIVNDKTRPGLCGARPAHGQVGDALELVGGGLGDTSAQVWFEDRLISSFTGWQDKSIKLNAPVFSPGTYPVRATVAGTDSNSVAYRIDERVIVGVPTISRLDPESGAVGEYVTLVGQNFGDQIGSVIFKDAASGETGQADVDFPAACSKKFWQNESIVVKIPKMIGGLKNTAVKPGTYQVSVMRQDRVVSNALPITVTANAPKPGLCAIAPDAGPVGTDIVLAGERFGSSAGQVSFTAINKTVVDASIDPKKWADGEVATRVPKGAITGLVRVTANKQVSNGIAYEVKNCKENANICAKGETCCSTGACSAGGACPTVSLNAEYAWRTSTGLIPINPEVVESCNENQPPSPTPWDKRDGVGAACVNADVIARFNTKLDPKTVTNKTFLVTTCEATKGDPCSSGAVVNGRAGYPEINVADDDTDYILFRPATGWAASTTYQVVLTTGIKSSTQVAMKERLDECGKGNGYCFRFTTTPKNEACKVGKISVAPNPFTAKDLG